MNKTGVYTITNLINGKIYVGSATKSFTDRYNSHFNYLKKNIHFNKHLQRAYNEYGKDSFKFEILEEHDPEQCIGMETYWINLLNTKDRKIGYNIQIPGHGMMGLKASAETCNRISNSLLGKRQSEDHRIKNSLLRKKEWASGKRNNMIGRQVSNETKLKLRIINLGKKHSIETKNKIKIKNIGKKLTHEHIEKIRMVRIGSKRSSESKKRMSDSQKKINNRPPSRLGIKHSIETKQKIRLKMLEKKLSMEIKEEISNI